jgi:hypothetical protein
MSTTQRVKIAKRSVEAEQKYVEELALAEQHGYLNGKNRIPKRLRIKR